VPSLQEDKEYDHWMKWHHSLDRQDEGRMQKALAFMVQAEDLAYFYVEEMKTRDWIRWEEVGIIVFSFVELSVVFDIQN
jgi:hypothetical protein